MERVAAHNRDYFKVDKDVTGMTTKITTLDTVNREVNELSICTDKANEFEYHLRVVTSNKPIVISGDDVRSIAELTRFIADLEDRARAGAAGIHDRRDRGPGQINVARIAVERLGDVADRQQYRQQQRPAQNHIDDAVLGMKVIDAIFRSMNYGRSESI